MRFRLMRRSEVIRCRTVFATTIDASTVGIVQDHGIPAKERTEDMKPERFLLFASATLFLALAAHPRTGLLAMRRRDADDGGRGGSSGGSGSGSSGGFDVGGPARLGCSGTFDDRNFVPEGSEPSTLSSRTAR